MGNWFENQTKIKSEVDMHMDIHISRRVSGRIGENRTKDIYRQAGKQTNRQIHVDG